MDISENKYNDEYGHNWYSYWLITLNVKSPYEIYGYDDAIAEVNQYMLYDYVDPLFRDDDIYEGSIRTVSNNDSVFINTESAARLNRALEYYWEQLGY